jgi:hypothetical protein
MTPKTRPKSSKLSSICLPSKVPEEYSDTMQTLQQLSSQGVQSSRWLICSWAAAGTHSINQRAVNGRFHNVIVLVQQSHICIGKNTEVGIGLLTVSTIVDDLKVSLLSETTSFKVPFQHLYIVFYYLEVYLLWTPSSSIINQLFSDIVDRTTDWR